MTSRTAAPFLATERMLRVASRRQDVEAGDGPGFRSTPASNSSRATTTPTRRRRQTETRGPRHEAHRRQVVKCTQIQTDRNSQQVETIHFRVSDNRGRTIKNGRNNRARLRQATYDALTVANKKPLSERAEVKPSDAS